MRLGRAMPVSPRPPCSLWLTLLLRAFVPSRQEPLERHAEIANTGQRILVISVDLAKAEIAVERVRGGHVLKCGEHQPAIADAARFRDDGLGEAASKPRRAERGPEV